MKQPNDGYFSLMELIMFEQIRENVQGKHCLHVGFDSLVPSFGHVCNQVQEFHEIFPSRVVLLSADLVVVSESSLLEDVLVDSRFCVNLIVFLG